MEEFCIGIEIALEDAGYWQQTLQKQGLLSNEYKIQKINDKIFLPLISTLCNFSHDLPIVKIPISRLVRKIEKNHKSKQLNLPFKRYELYGDFLILPESFPTLSFHFHLASILSNFHVNVIAQKQPIKSNCMRSPQLNFLYHHPSIVLDDYWCTTKQNGIIFTWKPSYTMFCAGNIHEKERVARFSCTGEVVLDLYAGIGYFTLPYLVHANAARVIAIDMNEASIEALKRNIELNGVSKERIVVFLGDNTSFVKEFEGECDRVNLGLLPSSQTGWRLAVLGLRKSGGVLHIHENIKEGYENEFSEFIKKRLEELWKEIKNEECLVAVNHIQKVKSFAPKVNHLVFDVEISARI